MNEGTPSIWDIIASGQTGLSEEKQFEVIELFRSKIASAMKRTTLLTLWDFIQDSRKFSHQIYSFCSPEVRKILDHQGVYVETKFAGAEGDLAWYIWGLSREGAWVVYYCECQADGFKAFRVSEMNPPGVLRPPEMCKLFHYHPVQFCRRLEDSLSAVVTARERLLREIIEFHAGLKKEIEFFGLAARAG